MGLPFAVGRAIIQKTEERRRKKDGGDEKGERA